MKDLEHGPYSLKNLERFANFMEDRFTVPVLNKRVGWDFVIGLIPVAGDLLTTLASLYILVGAWHHGVRKRVIARMLWNVLLDFLIGAVPLVGDILDASFRSNKKNVRLLLKALKSQQDLANLHKTKG